MAIKTPSTIGHRRDDDSLKDTFESIVIAFVLAFVFRAYVVEAFVIPTGSMAPTLYGKHLRVVCPQCGYTYATDTPDKGSPVTIRNQTLGVVCPMCHHVTSVLGQRISAGDRILVHKYIYSVTEPKRWDVVVFKAPNDPGTNFIKRLVGLPNERLWIIEGNIYTQPATHTTPSPPWRIARKTDRHRVQQAAWQPIYHSRYVPLDGGQRGNNQLSWRQPWVADKALAWDRSMPGRFKHTGPDRGVLQFRFQRALLWGKDRNEQPYPRNLFGYNQLKQPGFRLDALAHLEEVRIAAECRPEQAGLAVALRTTARLDDPQGRPMPLIGRIEQGLAWLEAIRPGQSTPTQLTKPVPVQSFTPGKALAVELWYVDQQASLWIGGRCAVTWDFELPIEDLKARKPFNQLSQIAIEVRGAPVTLHRLKVDRDIYYLSRQSSADYNPAHGTLIKTNTQPRGQPIYLRADQFFCLGDNSPMSQDSRFWNDLDDWIKRRMFDPSLSDEQVYGIVPRRLMMGRAFFVYFPAPYKPRLLPNVFAFVPDIGRMRFIH